MNTELKSIRVARLGDRLIKAAQIIGFAEPIVTLALLAMAMLLSAVDAMAQTPSGNIFGSDQQVGNAIREAIKWGRNLLFLMGVVFVGWGVVNYGTEKSAAKQIIAWGSDEGSGSTDPLPDEPVVYDKLTPFEYLEFVAGLWGIEGGNAERRAWLRALPPCFGAPRRVGLPGCLACLACLA